MSGEAQDNREVAENKHSTDIPSTHSAVYKSRKSIGISTGTFRHLRFGSVLRTWTEISKINFLSALSLDDLPKEQFLRSLSLVPRFISLTKESKILEGKSNDSIISEHFSATVTPLLNEDQLWGCFYNFPELYDDVYSPIVRIRNIEDVPEATYGVLTRDIVAVCLSYLKRTPILGDYVYIKLDVSSKLLKDIDVLQHYKYLVYLDLSSNFLTELKVLSNLLYLQYLSVDFNRLSTVLDYETAQWFLTEVHYKYNAVKEIRDISDFWSITILDLSHNNIKNISGLQKLRYLRKLDLSYNHIQRLDNLNYMRLLWLDVSYNNISSFEFGSVKGLWTLLHLEYLNLNENSLVTMKIFAGCNRLRELHARNNSFGTLLELAVYMKNMRRLNLLDLRSNPVCSIKGYKDVVYNTFPSILNLDAKDVDPIEQRISKMNMKPDINTFATHRLLRLLYIQQLSRSRVSPYTPPADNTDIPIVVIVGYEGVGKGRLSRELALKCTNVELALQHTTAFYHLPDHYKVITRREFDDMLLNGDLLTYTEMNGESYGLSREEAFIKDGKVKVVTMDLVGALMLKLRGYRPYLILAFCLDKQALAYRQQERKEFRNAACQKKQSMNMPMEISTLQVLLSGRIIISGVLNEILQAIPGDIDHYEFIMGSNCSLLMNSDDENEKYDKISKRIVTPTSSPVSLGSNKETYKHNSENSSIFSLYQEQQNIDTDEYVSDVCRLPSNQVKTQFKTPSLNEEIQNKDRRNSGIRKSIDFKYTSSSWKGFANSRKSSKSVAFLSTEITDVEDQETSPDPSGLMIEPQSVKDVENLLLKSISAKVPWPRADGIKPQDSDLWLAFLLENGLLQNSDTSIQNLNLLHVESRLDDPNSIVNQLERYEELPLESFTTNIRDDYEEIHRKSPGLFWDTVNMDNFDDALKKVKSIIKEIVLSHKNLKPAFDIDFANMKHEIIEKKLAKIQKQIAPQRLFY